MYQKIDKLSVFKVILFGGQLQLVEQCETLALIDPVKSSLQEESPDVRMALPLPARAPDPTALAAYWAEYEDLFRQISAAHDDDDNHYEDVNSRTHRVRCRN
ncbi:unnamed protein product [Spodoptera littoralis]|uniref:Uncharacterized protein n=1 Tax=Spodoptera littoralis TaxID=7109 RepID=A0A9P0MZT4_SPOLI|nr:unnamed protein product [Spodoptera littoralis]CAH1639395.1 unnamed protein product [Spodoptera littoralis]